MRTGSRKSIFKWHNLMFIQIKDYKELKSRADLVKDVVI